jgi:hypothetical protein
LREYSDLVVKLCSSDKLLLMCGVAKEINLDGMFIECDSSFVNVGDIYDVEFVLQNDGHAREYAIPVVAMKAENDGVKVGFSEFDTNIFCCIRDVMQYT